MLIAHMRDRLIPDSSGVPSGSNDTLTLGELNEEEFTTINNKMRTHTTLPVLLNMVVMQLLSTEKKQNKKQKKYIYIYMYGDETTRAS